MGSLLAMKPLPGVRRSAIGRNVATAAGLALIAFCALAYYPFTRFPGIAALAAMSGRSPYHRGWRVRSHGRRTSALMAPCRVHRFDLLLPVPLALAGNCFSWHAPNRNRDVDRHAAGIRVLCFLSSWLCSRGASSSSRSVMALLRSARCSVLPRSA